MTIAMSLKATGSAEVIVVVNLSNASLAAANNKNPAKILRHFKMAANSQDSALLEALNAGAATMASSSKSKKASLKTGVAGKSPAAATYYPNLGLVLGTVDKLGLAQLRKESDVKEVHLAPVLRMIRPVAKAAAAVQTGYTWGLRSIGIDQMHAQGITGKGVVIGHLDTGVDGSHPALAGAIKAFAEFDFFGHQVPDAIATDSGEHGTHTAGTIVGQPINGVRFGVAPGAKLVSAMVIENGNTIARILGGMNWIVGQGARILSMSLGIPGYEESFLAITRILRVRGVLPVFAVGNEGPGTSRCPGNYAEALSVGAFDDAGTVAKFSGSQRFVRSKDPLVPDLVGPGVDVISCVPNGQYSQMSGSSMATPHIAGLAALLMEAHPEKSIDEIEAAIFESCVQSPGVPQSRANRGIPNGIRALQKLGVNSDL